MADTADIGTAQHGHVTVVELRRPPYNFFDRDLIAALADVFEQVDADDNSRAIVLAAQGKAFCAGADFSQGAAGDLFDGQGQDNARGLYDHALRLFRTGKPIVAAVHGPAVGGGLGLSLVADFRVVGPGARFSANFVKLGVHAGFGISYVLPRIVGRQKASLMLCTGRRVGAEEALQMGLADVLAGADDVREQALALAAEIAEAAPLAVESTRATLRRGMVEAIEQQLQHEFAEQQRLARTADHAEGILAVQERRRGEFKRC